MRKDCLDRSIRDLASESSNIEYLPIDNTSHSYSTAGSALNHGVLLAKNDVVVFVHQDVYLHSLTSLKIAAQQLLDGDFGLIGAVGVKKDGRIVGRVRDRVVLLGEPVEQLTRVDSVDEVLFMASRAQLLKQPISESSDLAWHAYAVEYGLRMRKLGLRIGVADIPISHNSLSVNRERLQEAHQSLANQYYEFLPVVTTCGVIRAKSSQADRLRVLLGGRRWRYRWFKDSIALQRARNSYRNSFDILADIRVDVDPLIECAPSQRLRIININNGHPFMQAGLPPLELHRRDGRVSFSDCDVSELPETIGNPNGDSWILVANLSKQDLRALQPQLASTPGTTSTPGTIGFHGASGFWLLLGPIPEELPSNWRSKRTTPLGRTLVGASFAR